MKKRDQAIGVLAAVMLLGNVYPASISTAAASATTTQGKAATTNFAEASNPSDPQQAYMDLTLEEAGKLAGFAVKLPGYMPEENYYLAGLSYGAETKSVSVSFFGKGGNPIFMKMWKGDIAKEAAGLKEMAFSKGKAYVGKKQEYGEMNIFLWEEEKGVLYMMASGLEVGELDKMAQSMGKGDYSTIRRAIPIKGFESKNNLTVQQASEMSGIPVKLPSYPQNGKAANISYTLSYGDEYVLVKYDIPDMGNALLDIEIKKADLEEEAGNVPLIDYPNKNAKAIPFENGIAYTYRLSGSSFIKPELTHFNGFMWQEEKGVVYKLISDLPYEELMKIASSIK